MPKKKMTIEDLALMVAKGFEKTATKDQVVALGVRVDRLEIKMEQNHQELLAKISGFVPRSEFEAALERIEEIEKFVGIKNKTHEGR